ncbi:hypothetical protein VB834_10170 [Limnoraphis robusta Tam1]|uniref:DUF91 domain-containing protein n=1 Tax=Limnoraphis robusta CCNP1315 TaxID=3110306 RepID=A0ABU5TT66_9CYAN|nr:hypothetical protein [Limnoraphis robusta]MEA5498998.1 hypothetical protein [Limnoraphis robusta BA-68 BA1]MEA5518093.1 hypothetical protein [Limnoraphis robusta CCNP1315]MEA5539399.1 hypothetical protein [Limnoraphis robusta Tam1]MEA5547289.1 hypothetical protein [Limnoraphis robusta CCNP1324]
MLYQERGKLLFKSEALLEEVTWIHLESLLKLEKFKKQYFINKQNRSDILGITSQKQLAILELKKVGNKGCIDQLVRYQNHLKQEIHQFSESSKIDSSQDFILIAIASKFSSSAIEYAKQQIPNCILMTYEVIKSRDGEYFLKFDQINGDFHSKAKIEIVEDSFFDTLPSFIQGYLLANPDKREPILKIIEKILSYHPDLSYQKSFSYDSNGILKQMRFAKFNKQGEILPKKICIFLNYEIIEDGTKDKLYLILYLPTVDFDPRQPIPKCWKKRISFIFVETDDFIKVNELSDLNTKICKGSKFPLKYPLKTPEIDTVFDKFEDYYINYRKYMKSRQNLRPVDLSDFNSVEGIIQMTLEDWSVR